MTSPVKDGREILLDDISHPFSRERFKEERLPVSIGRLPDGALDLEAPCCLDMLIKLPGEDIVVPEPYVSHEGVKAFLSLCEAYEDGLQPGWRETHYAYLTFDCRIVHGGSTHRNGGWHFDGMQGSRYKEKLKTCHQYVVSSCLTTEFTSAATDASLLDEDRHNWFEELGSQVSSDAVIMRPDPLEVMAMSAYQLHRSPVAPENTVTRRTFIRLDISLKKQDRLGNTLNPDLPAPFPLSNVGFLSKLQNKRKQISGRALASSGRAPDPYHFELELWAELRNTIPLCSAFSTQSSQTQISRKDPSIESKYAEP